jgi:GxxExxY protein
MNNLLFENKTYSIIGLCMEVHRILGQGFSEIVYKDAMHLEANSKGIPVEREKEFKIEYKQVTLKHSYFADFVFFDEIIVEVKAVEKGIDDVFISQTLNYLKASGCRIGLIVNFGKESLEHKRMIF